MLVGVSSRHPCAQHQTVPPRPYLCSLSIFPILFRRGCSVWDMRTEGIVRTLETGKVATSLEVQRDGSFLTTADGSEVRALVRMPRV